MKRAFKSLFLGACTPFERVRAASTRLADPTMAITCVFAIRSIIARGCGGACHARRVWSLSSSLRENDERFLAADHQPTPIAPVDSDPSFARVSLARLRGQQGARGVLNARCSFWNSFPNCLRLREHIPNGIFCRSGHFPKAFATHHQRSRYMGDVYLIEALRKTGFRRTKCLAHLARHLNIEARAYNGRLKTTSGREVLIYPAASRHLAIDCTANWRHRH